MNVEYDMDIQYRWIKAIFEGKKIIECRKNNPAAWGRIKIGDTLNIFQTEQPNINMYDAKYKVIGIRIYKDVETCLLSEGLDSCLPGVEDLQEGLQIYYEDCGWKEEDVKKHGIIAIEIQKIRKH